MKFGKVYYNYDVEACTDINNTLKALAKKLK